MSLQHGGLTSLEQSRFSSAYTERLEKGKELVEAWWTRAQPPGETPALSVASVPRFSRTCHVLRVLSLLVPAFPFDTYTTELGGR